MVVAIRHARAMPWSVYHHSHHDRTLRPLARKCLLTEAFLAQHHRAKRNRQHRKLRDPSAAHKKNDATKSSPLFCNPLMNLVPPAGLEPATP